MASGGVNGRVAATRVAAYRKFNSQVRHLDNNSSAVEHPGLPALPDSRGDLAGRQARHRHALETVRAGGGGSKRIRGDVCLPTQSDSNETVVGLAGVRERLGRRALASSRSREAVRRRRTLSGCFVLRRRLSGPAGARESTAPPSPPPPSAAMGPQRVAATLLPQQICQHSHVNPKPAVSVPKHFRSKLGQRLQEQILQSCQYTCDSVSRAALSIF